MSDIGNGAGFDFAVYAIGFAAKLMARARRCWSCAGLPLRSTIVSARSMTFRWETGAFIARSANEGSKPALRGKSDRAAHAAERGHSRRAGHGAKMGRRKEEAVIALLTQRNVEEAARVAGIGTTTLYQWIKDPAFAAAYWAARLAAFGQASARLQQAAGAAVTVILKILLDPGTPAGTQARAADLALKYATEASEEDIEACLAELNRARSAAPAILPGDRRTFQEIAPVHPGQAP
jgi:hypothetical protein